MQPVISIIICTRNRADPLRDTLVSISQCEIPAHLPTELLVVNNGSSDATQQVTESATLSNMAIRHVWEPTKGQCHARNRGLAEAKGTFIIFTDDDVEVPRDWVTSMTQPFVDDVADVVVGGWILDKALDDRIDALGALGFETHMRDSAHLRALKVSQLETVGMNMAFHRKVAETIGGFDTCLGPGATGFADDTLFSHQAHAKGFRFCLLEYVRIIHKMSADRLTLDAVIQAGANGGRSKAYLDYHWHGVRYRRIRAMARWLKIWFATRNQSSLSPIQRARRAYDLGYVGEWIRLSRKSRKYWPHTQHVANQMGESANEPSGQVPSADKASSVNA